MAYDEQIPRKYFNGEQMHARVARFKDLKGFDGGLPDSYMPAAERILYNVIGFQPPAGEDDGVFCACPMVILTTSIAAKCWDEFSRCETPPATIVIWP